MRQDIFEKQAYALIAMADRHDHNVIFCNGFLTVMIEMTQAGNLRIVESDGGGRSDRGESIVIGAEDVESMGYDPETGQFQIVTKYDSDEWGGQGFDIEIYECLPVEWTGPSAATSGD